MHLRLLVASLACLFPRPRFLQAVAGLQILGYSAAGCVEANDDEGRWKESQCADAARLVWSRGKAHAEDGLLAPASSSRVRPALDRSTARRPPPACPLYRFTHLTTSPPARHWDGAGGAGRHACMSTAFCPPRHPCCCCWSRVIGTVQMLCVGSGRLPLNVHRAACEARWRLIVAASGARTAGAPPPVFPNTQ